jgi:YggT family protein
MSLTYERPAWKKIADQLVTIVCFILLGYVIISWIPALRSGPVGNFLEMIIGPVLAPIRMLIPPVGGLDLSVLVLYFALSFVQRRFLRH